VKIKTFILLVCCGAVAGADSYDTLLRRYARQIKQQERQLESLEGNLKLKQKEAARWQQKEGEAKAQWIQAGASVEAARQKVQSLQDRLTHTKMLADAAEGSAVEQALLAHASDEQIGMLARQIYEERLARPAAAAESQRLPERVAERLCDFSQAAHAGAALAGRQETALRSDELHAQNDERLRVAELDKSRERQQAQWLRWQEAQRRMESLAEEKNQLEQSQQALQVMLQSLKDHRDHTLAERQGRVSEDHAVLALKGTLPWPAYGKVTQNFGRQYSQDLQQLLVSNGIKIEADAGRPVRAIESGHVLFASPFRQYGRLVIIQHKSGLTSVYGDLGQTQVKEGDHVEALDALGTIGEKGSFYFELRRNEEPINPLVYLTPIHRSDLSLRRKFQ